MTAKKPEQAATKIKAYRVVISGTYRNSKKEYIDFQDVEGVIPFNPSKEYLEAMVRKRYAAMWIAKDKEYKERIVTVREVFIDTMEETEAEFEFIGKEIRELTYEDLQDVATFKGLRQVPLYKKGGLRQAHVVTYAAYSKNVLGIPVDYREEGFNFSEQPPIKIDAEADFLITKPLSNEEIIELEQGSLDARTGAKKTIDRKKLEQLARERGVIFNKAISTEKLYDKVFNG